MRETIIIDFEKMRITPDDDMCDIHVTAKNANKTIEKDISLTAAGIEKNINLEKALSYYKDELPSLNDEAVKSIALYMGLDVSKKKPNEPVIKGKKLTYSFATPKSTLGI